MKLSISWLRQWVNPAMDNATLAKTLTLAGLEASALEPVASQFSGVVVGAVDHCEKHPDADKLSICQVDIGALSPLNIVCGAQNVRTGLKVAVACIGAILPGDFKIRRSKLRGVVSEGMLCSTSELGLSEHSEGIFELPADAPLGVDLRDYMNLDDEQLELELTPNRGDCLSIAGIARELAATTARALTPPSIPNIPVSCSDQIATEVQEREACPLYLTRVVRDIDVSIPTPLWLKEALRRSGLRSIDAVVDVCNFVMLELGQPLHAFDLDQLHGGLCVGFSAAGTPLTLLDGREIELDDHSLVISDAHGPAALAGIMGGQRTAVSPCTRHILLESAWFNPLIINGRARRYGLHTDAAHRFERGVDPQLARKALERATARLVEIVGGQPGPINEVLDTDRLPQLPNIPLRLSKIQRLTGLTVSIETVESCLVALGMSLQRIDAVSWQITPPSHRFDIRLEVDLIEEVARFIGYDHLPESTLKCHFQPAAIDPLYEFRQRCLHTLVSRGYHECINYAFTNPELQRQLHPNASALALENPIAQTLSVMQTSLWTGLLQNLSYNLNRQQTRVRLFETGSCFVTEAGTVTETPVISGLLYGSRFPSAWNQDKHWVDFYDIKGDVEALLSATALQTQCIEFQPATLSSLHPGQQAKVIYGGHIVGHFGALHPALQRQLKFDHPVYLFELTLEKLANSTVKVYNTISKHPAIKRDLSLLVDDTVSFHAIHQEVKAIAGPLLVALVPFDVYKGDGITVDKKSLAFSMTLQHPERTLVDEEIMTLTNTIIEMLKNKFNATLRD